MADILIALPDGRDGRDDYIEECSSTVTFAEGALVWQKAPLRWPMVKLLMPTA